MALQRGALAPAFETTDINGQPIRLADLRGRPLLLAFHRFSSCPFCNFRVHQLKTRYAALHALGLEIVTVFESSAELLRAGVAKQQLPFPIVSDRERRLYALYETETSVLGVAKAAFKRLGDAREAQALGLVADVPRDAPLSRMPADFVIDREGRIHSAYYGTDMGDHLPLESLDEIVRRL